MANVCEECSAANTDDATVCQSCGYPLYLALATFPITPFRRAGTAATQAVSMLAVMPAGSRRLIAWLVGGLAAMVLLALAAFIVDIASSQPQRMQFGPNAPPLAPMLPMSLVEAASPQSLTAEAAVFAASSASAIAAPPLPSRAPTPAKKATAGQSSVKPPAAGTINPAGAEAGTPASDPPIAVLAVPLPATSEIMVSHSEICGDKSFLALGICLAKQCNTPALSDHPDCVQIREQDNKRREREELGG